MHKCKKCKSTKFYDHFKYKSQNHKVFFPSCCYRHFKSWQMMGKWYIPLIKLYNENHFSSSINNIFKLSNNKHPFRLFILLLWIYINIYYLNLWILAEHKCYISICTKREREKICNQRIHFCMSSEKLLFKQGITSYSEVVATKAVGFKSQWKWGIGLI